MIVTMKMEGDIDSKETKGGWFGGSGHGLHSWGGITRVSLPVT